MVTVEEIRGVTLSLPRSYEAVVRDRIKFRVGRIVYVALSRDETTMGFGFPKDERAAMIAAEPDKFFAPSKADERYHWLQVRLDAIDVDEMRELVIDAWRMCVPKKVSAEYDQRAPRREGAEPDRNR
ncbi:MmcQ/YjbR family DNA-binding protein [Actinokineospora sp. HUAS TT18]|uniref:MmcQ/YjbR family DNA-binding protein n=1 Tax=Actinokineospora sp. HUAS TT18 TaxID=3447451 RepID=UPI003F525043